MKLRSRARRTAVIIKREDYSVQTHLSSEARVLVPNTTLSIKKDSESCTPVKQEESFTSTPIISNMKAGPNEEMDKTIKQEETFKTKTALELYKNDNDYYYQCRLCLQIKDSFQSLREHRKVVHGIKEGTLSIRHMHLEPDLHDPNHFCQSCEKTFSSKANYRQHLASCHHISLRCGLNSNIFPDPQDPNFYCSSCQRASKDWACYRNHLITIHGMEVRSRHPLKNPAILPDWNDPNFHCAPCNTDYLSRKQYSAHCTNAHQMKCPKKTENQVELLDLHDSNFSCKCCKKATQANAFLDRTVTKRII